MIKYRTYTGREVTRLDYGERQRVILQALTKKPWQTQAELGTSAQQIKRMMAQGILVRRERDAKWHPYEYSLGKT